MVACPGEVMISIFSLLKLITKALPVQKQNRFQPNCDVLMYMLLAQTAPALVICELVPLVEIHCRIMCSYKVSWDQKHPNCTSSTSLYLNIETMLRGPCKIIQTFLSLWSLKKKKKGSIHCTPTFSLLTPYMWTLNCYIDLYKLLKSFLTAVKTENI